MPSYKTGQSGRDFGNKDLVTIGKMVEGSAPAQRKALNDAAELQHLRRTYPRDTVDGMAGRMSVEHHYDARNEWDSRDARERLAERNIEHILFRTSLTEHYTVHPENPGILNARVFVYQPQIDAMVLDIDSTLKYCGVESNDPNLAFYRAILAAEAGLSENARLVRTAGRVFEKEVPRKPTSDDTGENVEIVETIRKARSFVWQF